MGYNILSEKKEMVLALSKNKIYHHGIIFFLQNNILANEIKKKNVGKIVMVRVAFFLPIEKIDT